MVTRQSAIRAWVEPADGRREKRKRGKTVVGWRPQRYGERVLVFDTETTTDAAQRLLFGISRLYHNDRLQREGLVVTDILNQPSMKTAVEYATRHRLKIWSREDFVEKLFYPEVYERGTLCVGYNLPFDLTRIAVKARPGNGQHRRKFTVVLSNRIRWHDLRIESSSGSASFIQFAPKRKLLDWECPFFTGRFLDLSAAARAFTGKRHSLKSAGKAFRAFTQKMDAPDLGTVTREALTYCRQDVRATYALYQALRREYIRHPFATFENELHKPAYTIYMGELSSTASIGKAYLRQLGIRPLLEKQSDFDPTILGWFIAAYFGGRSDVRVRKTDVPVWVLDFTSMYPTIFCLQRLDRMLASPRLGLEDAMEDVKALVERIRSDIRYLFDPKVWPMLNCLVLLDPNGAILPIRMRVADKDPYTIAVTPIETAEGRWYTLADVLAGVLLGGPVPNIRKAVRVVAKGRRTRHTALFRNEIELHSTEPFFTTIVEQRQIAKSKSKDPQYEALELGLKQMAAGGSYGIYAEINITPGKNAKIPMAGTVYSDITYPSPKIHDERPGTYANPIIATLVTGGARLMLALLESEVVKRGGAFAFCDTDSLAIVGGSNCPNNVPSITKDEVDAIVAQFNALNPYNRAIVPNLLKIEYSEYSDLRCFAISAKRYVLFRWRPGKRIQIVKASESALGAIIGRTKRESISKLARRIWYSILFRNLNVSKKQRRRAKPLIAFDLPMRRKFPVSQPAILRRLEAYNKTRTYDFRVKPSGFVQTLVPDRQFGPNDVLPIAPFESNLQQSIRLPWTDFKTGSPIRIDWFGSGHANAIGVISLQTYIDAYQRHAESKAADASGNAAGEDTIGLLHRLPIRSAPVSRIGKEVDRLGEDEGADLDAEQPIEYQRNDLRESIDSLARFPQAKVAREIGISIRAWRNISKGDSQPRLTTALRIRRLAERVITNR
jgi:hypothetical protein